MSKGNKRRKKKRTAAQHRAMQGADYAYRLNRERKARNLETVTMLTDAGLLDQAEDLLRAMVQEYVYEHGEKTGDKGIFIANIAKHFDMIDDLSMAAGVVFTNNEPPENPSVQYKICVDLIKMMSADSFANIVATLETNERGEIQTSIEDMGVALGVRTDHDGDSPWPQATEAVQTGMKPNDLIKAMREGVGADAVPSNVNEMLDDGPGATPVWVEEPTLAKQTPTEILDAVTRDLAQSVPDYAPPVRLPLKEHDPRVNRIQALREREDYLLATQDAAILTWAAQYQEENPEPGEQVTLTIDNDSPSHPRLRLSDPDEIRAMARMVQHLGEEASNITLPVVMTFPNGTEGEGEVTMRLSHWRRLYITCQWLRGDASPLGSLFPMEPIQREIEHAEHQ